MLEQLGNPDEDIKYMALYQHEKQKTAPQAPIDSNKGLTQ